MQSENSFDLNRSIRQWRENLGYSPAFQRENLDELEAHLRDSMATLQARGLSAEEAFLVAMKRIGNSDTLADEFAAVNQRAVLFDRMLWVLAGFQLCLVTFDFCRLVSGLSSVSSLRMSPIFVGNALRHHSPDPVLWAWPLTTVVLALLVWSISRRPSKMVRTSFAKLLKHPLALAIFFPLLDTLMRLVSEYVYGFIVLGSFSQPFTTAFQFGSKFPGTGSFSLIMPQFALCAVLTMLVARRCQHWVKA